MSKVFVIGAFRTGTSSVGEALSVLGYKTMRNPWYVTPIGVGWPTFRSKHHILIKERVKHYDAFKDYPWMFLFRELAEWYPDAKFIYTQRDPYTAAQSELKKWRDMLSGSASVGEEMLMTFHARQQRHQKEVAQFLKGRDDVLQMSIVEGDDGWEKLCGFLCREVPEMPFPHLR